MHGRNSITRFVCGSLAVALVAAAPLTAQTPGELGPTFLAPPGGLIGPPATGPDRSSIQFSQQPAASTTPSFPQPPPYVPGPEQRPIYHPPVVAAPPSNRPPAALAAPPDYAGKLGNLATNAPPGGELPPPAGLTPQQVEQIVDEYLRQRESVPPGPATPWYVVGSDTGFRGYWRYGPEFETANKDFRVHVGGRTQVDTAWFNTDRQLEGPTPGTVGPINDSINFRRGRFRIDGTMYETVDFAAEYDFIHEAQVVALPGNPPGSPPSAAVVSVTDLWATLTKLPVLGNFRIGNFKEPIGMEHLTSSRWLNFMERSFNQDAFYGPFNNGFSPGMMVFNWTEDERATWALWAGASQSNLFGYGIGDGEYAVTARGTILPYYDAEGRYLLHLGVSASHHSPDQGQFRLWARGPIRSGPPSLLNPIYADTGSMLGDSQQLFNLEAASVWGPLTLAAEYTGSWVGGVVSPNALPPVGIARGTPYFQGGYLEALWFLTGEHRAYQRQFGVFDRVVPHSNFFSVRDARGYRVRSIGGWQIGARYSGVDLNANGINGGRLDSFTFGVNWFLNPNMKFQFNYDFTHRSRVQATPAGFVHGLGVRMAMDF